MLRIKPALVLASVTRPALSRTRITLASHRLLSTSQPKGEPVTDDNRHASMSQRRAASHTSLPHDFLRPAVGYHHPTPPRLSTSPPSPPADSNGPQEHHPLDVIDKKLKLLETAIKEGDEAALLTVITREFPYTETLRSTPPTARFTRKTIKAIAREGSKMTALVLIVLLKREFKAEDLASAKRGFKALRKTIQKALTPILESGNMRRVNSSEIAEVFYAGIPIERLYNFAPCPIGGSDKVFDNGLDTGVLSNLLGPRRMMWISECGNVRDPNHGMDLNKGDYTTTLGAIREYRCFTESTLPGLLHEFDENHAIKAYGTLLAPYGIVFDEQRRLEQERRHDLIKICIADLLRKVKNANQVEGQEEQRDYLADCSRKMGADIGLAVASTTDAKCFLTADRQFADAFGKLLWAWAGVIIRASCCD
ncbi:hypothetical protein BJ508DRAFT_321266 [Ascobolus immersus RN42]|uniref:Uncharacterized protein n=1 Tax=Ascobolus immersus RN42 TaxID=1160509 RepID=A0A3N4IR20_ASCIM|nr:hypothetical protein BJ508DRAFT_321266 [Ascobolus immersus RN42]